MSLAFDSEQAVEERLRGDRALFERIAERVRCRGDAARKSAAAERGGENAAAFVDRSRPTKA